MAENQDFDLGGDLFAEPEGYLKPEPESHFVSFQRKEGKTPSSIQLKLVGKSPLWGHLLWNAGKYTANYLDVHADELVKGKKVLELGAAAGLPSLVCGANGASEVICTDYPDPDLLSHIQYNVDHLDSEGASRIKVQGFIWGNDEAELCKAEVREAESPQKIEEEDKFDLVILSDLVFNHTEHEKLLRNCENVLKRTGVALVVFSPHRPWLLEKDLEFFKTCEDFNLSAEKVEQVNWTPMFEEDEETEEIRSRVYCYKLHPKW